MVRQNILHPNRKTQIFRMYMQLANLCRPLLQHIMIMLPMQAKLASSVTNTIWPFDGIIYFTSL